MLGNNLFRVDCNVDLSNERYKSLILFYNPLIGNDAHYLYEYLVIKGNSSYFDELNKILNSLNISIDLFEKSINKLNEYKLVRTLKNDEDNYIFVLSNPLTVEEFIKDDLFVRDFIMKTSGLYYQSLISDIRTNNKYDDFKDVSTRYNPVDLKNWTADDETFLKNEIDDSYDFGTFFNINTFLENMSTNLFPLKYRTEENLMEICKLADLYNISYDRMRSYIPKVSQTGKNIFDLKTLRYLCENSIPEYKYIDNATYEIPCQLFLMNKQEGKELSPYDKKIIYNLSHEYNLKPGVINVILEHTLMNCNNMLLEKYIYPIASDFHRNNVEKSEDAKQRLSGYKTKDVVREELEKYDNSNNPEFDSSKREALLNRRGKNEQTR